MKVAWLRLLLIVALGGLILAACGSDESYSAQTNSYSVRLTLDQRRIGETRATVDIRTRDGQPANIQTVQIIPMMTQHGMVSPEAQTTLEADGRYHTHQIFFSMDGDWQLDVAIDDGVKRETATFHITVLP